MSDFTIVGGGLMGLLVARELVAAGARVRVLERGRVGEEASWAGGGILSPLYPWRYPESVNRLAQWSQAAYPQLAEALADSSGVDPQWSQSGLIIDALHGERETANRWAAHYASAWQWLTTQEAHACQPGLGHLTAPVMWLPQVAQVRNPRLLQALQSALRSAGVVLQEAAEVNEIHVQRGKVHGITVGGEFLDVEQLVVCGGAWTAHLLEKLGIRLPVQPVRGQMLLFRAQPELLRRIVLSHDRYVIPRRDGHILVGSTLEYVGFDKTTTAAAHAELVAEALRIFPVLAEFPIEKQWAGLRPGSPDGVPFIAGCADIEGLYVSAGHFRNGVVLGPASARLLVDIMLSREPILDPDPYRLPPRMD